MSCLFRKTEYQVAFPPTELSDQWLEFYGRHGGFLFLSDMKTYIHEHRIPFQDTDMAGVVHYTSVLGYVELAEHAFLAELGIEVISSEGGLPKVHVDCDYLYPLKFGDRADVYLTLSKCSHRSLHWQFEIKVGEEYCAKGQMITAYVNVKGESSKLPADWLRLLT